jgi:diguanylate cyclase (GGDEF)-like protein
MNKIKWPSLIGWKEREDTLAAYRRQVMLVLSGVAVVFLVPFAVSNFMQGRGTLGFGLFSVLAILCIDAVALHLKRRPPIPMEVLIIPAIGGTAISLESQGFYVALWSYPTVLLFHFAMPRLKATVFSLLQLGAVSALVYHYIGAEVALRFCATLMLTILLINVALGIVDDLHRRLIEQTIIDPLTGAFNRRHMESSLDYAIERARRAGAPVSLLLIDIDHFKRINDELGHAAGDSVLRRLVALIQKRARRLDLLFRIGGEEFLLLLPDTRESDAARAAQDIRAVIASTMLLPQRAITVSIGVSELHPGETRETWLKQADEALYAAKNNGRDRVVPRTALNVAEH